MKQFLLFCLSVFIFPSGVLAASQHLEYAFKKHCEDTDLTCISDIDESEDFFELSSPLGQSVLVDLVVRNPNREMLTSVRAKLKFNPLQVQVTKMHTEDSDFSLPAPNENEINEEESTIKIGRSLLAQSRNDDEFLVATFAITPLTKEATLEFLNYQETELGDTGIFFVQGMTTENRLKKEPLGLRFGHTNTVAPAVLVDPITGQVIQNIDNTETGNRQVIPRPNELRVQTDEQGNVRLIWTKNTHPEISGHYLYYSQNSGEYLRRKNIQQNNFAFFPNLTSGKKYYFAITAYDQQDNESDYSDEVFVTVGLMGSESHGFIGDPQNQTGDADAIGGDPNMTANDGAEEITLDEDDMHKPEDADTTIDSGPEHILFFLIVSVGLACMRYATRMFS